MKLTALAAQAFTNLRGNPDFVTVMQWLEENRTRFQNECCTFPPEKVQRPQGKVEVVNDIFRAFNEAPRLTEKVKSKL